MAGSDWGVYWKCRIEHLQTMYQQEKPEVASRGTVVEPEASAMWEFMGKAIVQLKKQLESSRQLSNRTE